MRLTRILRTQDHISRNIVVVISLAIAITIAIIIVFLSLFLMFLFFFASTTSVLAPSRHLLASARGPSTP